MTNALRNPADYELFIYTLPEQFPIIRLGTSLARIAGELHFEKSVRLVVRERILYDRLPAVIDEYGYEVWRGEEKLYWYDPQPHPDAPALQSSHPHHKHIPPDIKHHRIPAPQMSFTQPNLPVLIGEIEELLKTFEESKS